ncbi:hypothetical protein AWB74_06328 [Caballeronia arvi]|uniref:Uncharacterized protein n=1 Tax=Caballeronia arvi TaxID=1777135 RepID=A0A158KPE2_9BURK|nr:hypothetical protein [Caballeronia arvi]SAL82619.1 hypothetical protein AWB74_06328 [Caballeronia arvi]
MSEHDQELVVDALFDVLHAHAREELTRLAARHPIIAALESKVGALGGDEAMHMQPANIPGLLELARASLRIIPARTEQLNLRILKRLTVIRYVSFGGSVAASLGSAGVIPALLKDSPRLALVSAIFAFLAGLSASVANFLELPTKSNKRTHAELRAELISIGVDAHTLSGTLDIFRTMGSGKADEARTIAEKANEIAARLRAIDLEVGMSD